MLRLLMKIKKMFVSVLLLIFIIICVDTHKKVKLQQIGNSSDSMLGKKSESHEPRTVAKNKNIFFPVGFECRFKLFKESFAMQY